MIYKIFLDGNNIYGLSEDTEILSPKLTMELNTAGTLDFTLPPFHKKYDSPKLLTSDVEVYENDDLIWFGRVLSISTEFNKNKAVQCEGPLAFFNDSIQRPYEYNETTVHAFFRDVIANHNEQVPPNRQFEVGNITVDDVTIYRKLNYHKTIDVINNMCLNAEGGYIFFRKDNGINYIDWLSDMPYYSSQPIQFGINLTDLTSEQNGSKIVTSVIPLGAEVDGTKVTIASVNDGYDYLDSEATSTFGRITQVIEYSGITIPSELKALGQKWLESQDMSPFTIECHAAELNYMDDSYKPFRVGQNVHVISSPHLIDTTLPLNKIEISLDSAVKEITVGTQEEQELTEIYKS